MGTAGEASGAEFREDPADLELTRAIGAIGRSVAFDDLPRGVVERVQCSLLDWLAAVFAGMETSLARIIREVTARGAGSGHAGVFGGTFPVIGPVDAALVNGTTAHALDFDDSLGDPEISFGLAMHPSASTMAAALALAQSEDASGRRFVEAVVAAQETIARVVGLVGVAHARAGWHATGTIGAFGCAAAGARLLDLDLDRWEMALGLAGTQAAGLRASFGSMGKPLHPGRAASNGVLSALLAESGFTGPSEILETRYGFPWTHNGEGYVKRALRPLGPPYVAEKIRYKMHASCGGTHCAIEVMRAMRETHGLVAADIDRIVVRVPAPRTTSCNIESPQTALEGKFSLRYTTTAALLGWDTTGPCFDDALVTSPEAVSVMKRITVEGIDLPSVAGPTEIEISTRDGRRFVLSRTDDDRGGPADWSGLTDKYLRLAEVAVGESLARELLELVAHLDELTSMRELHKLVRRAGTG